MGLFTTRQLLGYTEQKVKFRALFLELFFRRTVNFHTEEVMLDKITGKTPVAAYVSPVVEGKVLRHRGGETRVLRPGYVKPKHEFPPEPVKEPVPPCGFITVRVTPMQTRCQTMTGSDWLR